MVDRLLNLLQKDQDDLIFIPDNNVPSLDPSCQDQQRKSDRELWEELVKETEDLRKSVEEYKLSKNPVLEPPPHPVITYLNDTVFPSVNNGLIAMLEKVKAQEYEIFTEGHSYLNSLNFLAEYLWNMNPNHPQRQEHWTDIYDIIW